MKKHQILLIGMLLILISVNAQQVARDKVVLEIVTGTWCYYCPGAAMGADDLIANGHDVAVIEYHSSDAFANSYSNARKSYYNITGVPTAKFDGVLTVVGGNHTQSMYGSYLPKYNQRIAIPSSFSLSMSGYNNGLNYSVQVIADKVASYSGTNLVLHFALTESNISYNWQGQNHLNFVERLMAPDHNGTPLNFSDKSSEIINLNFTIDNSWVVNNCEVVAFIQDNNTKEILQGIKSDLNNLAPPYAYGAAIKSISDVPVHACMGEVNPVVKIQNEGSQSLTNLDFYYKVNGNTYSNYSWSGNVGFGQTADVTLPTVNFSVLENNELKVYTAMPNGQPDENPVNDTMVSTFVDAENFSATVKLNLLTDGNPGETEWELTDGTGQVLFSGGPYTLANNLHQETMQLPGNGCYRFIIYDTGGNGICCDNGNGYYEITRGDGQVIYTGAEFQTSEIQEFSVNGFELDLKAYLEGPYNGSEMNRSLTIYGYTPLNQPYNTDPWNYAGAENVSAMPNLDVVDWILVELREASGGPATATSGTAIATRAAFLMKDGSIKDLDGSYGLFFETDVTDNLYVVLWHRNHLAVMSNYPLQQTGGVYSYDFSSGADQAYGGINAHIDLGSGVYGMVAGDGDSNGQIANADKNTVWVLEAGTSGYLNGDFNMDRQVENADKNILWIPNSGSGSQIVNGLISNAYSSQVPK